MLTYEILVRNDDDDASLVVRVDADSIGVAMAQARDENVDASSLTLLCTIDRQPQDCLAFSR